MSDSKHLDTIPGIGLTRRSGALRAWLQLMRVPNSFTAMSNILAAQLIVTGGLVEWRPLILLMLASVYLYTAGIVLNDCFDVEEDRRERPFRPLPSGRISLAAGFAAGAVLLGAGVTCAAWVGATQGLIAAAIAVLVLAYDAYAKHTPAGPLAMAACRFGNWLLGLSYGGNLAVLWPLAVPALLYITSLTVLSRAETHAARRGPLLFCAGGVLLTAAVIVALFAQGLLFHIYALALLAGALVLAGARFAKTWRDYSPAATQATVKMLVLGIIPLDALLTFAGGPWWGGLAVFALLLPSSLLARRIYVT